MESRLDVASAYFRGFEASDHAAILALLTDDVVWTVHGHGTFNGKQEFDGEIENEAFQGSPVLTVERIIDGDDVVVVPHLGQAQTADGAPFRFSAVDVLTFRDTLICRVDSYVVPLPE